MSYNAWSWVLAFAGAFLIVPTVHSTTEFILALLGIIAYMGSGYLDRMHRETNR